MKTLFTSNNLTQIPRLLETLEVDHLFKTYGNNMSFFGLFKSQFTVINIVNQLIRGTCTVTQYESPRITAF